jgi:DNA-binding Lrp family transcriptional regulator
MASDASIRRDIEPVQLDEVDRRLIELLRQDGRASNRALASVVSLTEVTVASRIKRLVANDVIALTAVIDWEAAGYEWFLTGQFRCENRPPREVADDLATIPSCVATSIVFGEVDIIATFLLADRADMQRLVSHDLSLIKGAEAIALDVSVEQHKYQWSTATFPVNAEPDLRFPSPAVDLDDLDHQLIAALVRDSRQSNREIGRQLDVSEGTIRLRLRRLTEAGLLRLTAVVDPVVLGTVTAVAFCFVQLDRAGLAAALTTLTEMPQCWQLSTIVGRFDLELLLVCRDRQELVETVLGEVRNIPGVRRTATMEVIEVPHHAYHWASFVSEEQQ